jgi:hypothetical protein
VRFGFDELKVWYSKHATKRTSFPQIETKDAAPIGGSEGTYIQRISHKVALIRDRALVKTVERMLSLFDRVLVIFGGSHLLTEEPAFAEAMGPAEYSKLY